MKIIYITRHGEIDLNKDGKYSGRINVSLNSTGITQAKQLAEKANDFNVDVIYCSPLKRTMETAKFVKSKHNCEMIIDNHFIERSVGVYEGLTKKEAKNKYPDLYKQNITRIFNQAPPNGETIDEVIERVFIGLDKIKKQNRYSNIIIITHGFVAKVINKYFNPKISKQDFFDFRLSNAEIKDYSIK